MPPQAKQPHQTLTFHALIEAGSRKLVVKFGSQSEISGLIEFIQTTSFPQLFGYVRLRIRQAFRLHQNGNLLIGCDGPIILPTHVDGKAKNCLRRPELGGAKRVLRTSGTGRECDQ